MILRSMNLISPIRKVRRKVITYVNDSSDDEITCNNSDQKNKTNNVNNNARNDETHNDDSDTDQSKLSNSDDNTDDETNNGENTSDIESNVDDSDVEDERGDYNDLIKKLPVKDSKEFCGNDPVHFYQMESFTPEELNRILTFEPKVESSFKFHFSSFQNK